jgi:hypothetical protein
LLGVGTATRVRQQAAAGGPPHGSHAQTQDTIKRAFTVRVVGACMGK